MSPKKWRNSRSRFVKLPHHLLRSYAWHSLTPLQRAAYIEIAQLYDGKNNGRLAMSARMLASLIPCGRNSASRCLRCLEDTGFIDNLKFGKYTRRDEERLASEYRLTEFRCDATGEPPSRRYNPKHHWDRSIPKPKRKALTAAERARRYRKRRNERHAKRHPYEDGTVTSMGTVNVTPFPNRSRGPQKTAKNLERKSADVTLSVTPMVTHIHLTRGREIADPPLRVNTGEKHISASPAPGHATCPIPKTNSLPPGWHWCKHEKCLITETGIQVPVADHELVGTDEGRAARLVLLSWKQRRGSPRTAA